jgi:hypothetical protein
VGGSGQLRTSLMGRSSGFRSRLRITDTDAGRRCASAASRTRDNHPEYAKGGTSRMTSTNHVEPGGPDMQAPPNSSQPPAFATIMGHPSSLRMLFMTEFWERFAFYGKRLPPPRLAQPVQQNSSIVFRGH